MKKPDDRTIARVVLLNLLVLPGLGSLRGGRVFQGIGQITLVVVGTVLLLVWLFKEMSQYYGLMFGEVKPEADGWLGEVGGVLFLVAWLWALITSLNFYRAVASRGSYSFENFPAPPKLDVAAPEIISALHTIPDWKRQGEIISRTFVFKDFPAAMEFTNAVASLAEQAQHHPDIDVRWNKVTLALTTHDAGGLTAKDFALARQCDALSLR